MQFWLGVKNFAKIESAKIRTDGFTVLAGPNNSGKTFLMQLLYGVGSKLPEMIGEDVAEVLITDGEDSNKYMITEENVEEIVKKINKKLQKEKETIVKYIFKKDIKIDELYIDIALEENSVCEIYIADQEREIPDKIIGVANSMYDSYIDMTKIPGREYSFIILVEKNLNTEEYQPIMGNISFKKRDKLLLEECLKRFFKCETLYFPASRNGLILLYRDFFASRADMAVNSYERKGDQWIGVIENYGEITQPVYEFLHFLQMYTESDDLKDFYKEELDFFEKKLLEGHISVNKQGIFSYQPDQEENLVPMYVASSMINEIAPFSLALTGTRLFKRLIVDEVETSLHPLKQQELMRFFCRLNRNGMKLILSTHSDTFVSKLNNMYVFTNRMAQGNKKIIEGSEFTEEDLLNLEDLSVYEFMECANGKYKVKEIAGDPEMGGYQFDLFTNSVVKLYEEADQWGDI